MSSILTNNSAMVALQTMKSISSNLATTTGEISTGKRVASAKDNAAVWAISKVMESDVKGFQGISDSLSLGSSTLAVAAQAAATVTDLLTKMKGKIVAAQEQNVDRTKIQADIDTLTNQINSVVGAAQFNGLNLVNNANSVDILSSLDRSGNAVTAGHITVAGQDLSTGTYTAKAVFTGSTGESASGDTAGFTIDATGGATATTQKIVIDNTTPLAAGDTLSVVIGGKTASYTVTAADATATTPEEIVAVGLKSAIESLGISGLTINYDAATNPGELDFTNASSNTLTVSTQYKNQGAGGLSALNSLSVTTDAGATAALGNIETMLQTSINASAAFGSIQGQVDTQKTFVGNLIDSMKTGIGSLVDADMEEASARLQALQVQQQLSTQALSIANQQPQALLSLFR